MLALEAILGTPLVMNHVLYLILILFLLCPGFSSSINKHHVPGVVLGVGRI